MTRTGIRLSEDGDSSDATEVYEAICRPELQDRPFACMTAQIAATYHSRSITGLYGRGSGITLLVNWSAVFDRLLIFNGDVGRLGKALKRSAIKPSFVRVLTPTASMSDVETELNKLYQNSCLQPPIEPRVQGNSFEARLFDGIHPSDISQICIATPEDAEAMTICRTILRLRK